MQILEPNTGNKIQPIYKGHVFVAITDYGLLYVLREVRIKYGEIGSRWIWVPLKENHLLVIGGDERDNEYKSFNQAINRWVNDPYCTVYDFDSFAEMFRVLSEGGLKYEDTISTIYKGKEEE